MGKLLVLVLLLGFVGSATAESRCKEVRRHSLGLIKCRYIAEHDEWRLKYSTFAYDLTHKSGRHDDMIAHLCGGGANGVQEDIGPLSVYTPCKETL